MLGLTYTTLESLNLKLCWTIPIYTSFDKTDAEPITTSYLLYGNSWSKECPTALHARECQWVNGTNTQIINNGDAVFIHDSTSHNGGGYLWSRDSTQGSWWFYLLSRQVTAPEMRVNQLWLHTIPRISIHTSKGYHNETTCTIEVATVDQYLTAEDVMDWWTLTPLIV